MSSGSYAIWLSPAQVPLARAIVSRWGNGGGSGAGLTGGGLKIVGSHAVGQAKSLATEFKADTAADDLRSTLATMEPGLVFLLDPGPLGAAETTSAQRIADHDLIESCNARGVRIVTLEPLPASLIDLFDSARGIDAAEPPPVLLGPEGGDESDAGADFQRLGGWAMLAPLARFTPSVRAALDHLESFGPIRSASVRCLGSAIGGSLGARLFDALDLLHLFMGTAESIDAGYSAAGDRSLRPLPGDSLRNLHGDLCGAMRYSGARAASIHVSDHAGQDAFSITLVGTSGSMTASSGGFVWIDNDGRVHEDTRSGETISDYAQRIVDQARRFDEGREDLLNGASASNFSAVLAMAHAAMLSVRTGEAERPATMVKMAGG